MKNKLKKMNKDKVATYYALFEKSLEIIINFLINFIVIRMLDVKDYAIITVIAGYASFVGFINIAPESQLYKTFHSLTKDELRKQLMQYVMFNFFKGLLIEVVYICLGIYLAFSSTNENYVMYAVLFGLTVFGDIFWQLFRLSLELQYKQKILVRITFFSKVIKLILFLLIFQTHSLFIYSIINFFVTVLQVVIGIKSTYGKTMIRSLKQIVNLKFFDIKKSFSEFALFNHISGVLNSIIYFSDTVFLQMFVGQTLIGHYGVTLGCINYINIIFQIIQKQVAISLGTSNDVKRNRETVLKFLKISVLGSITIFVGYLILGKYILEFYAGDSYIDDMYVWGIFILAGTSLFNSIRPLFSYVLFKGNIKKYITRVLIPVFVFTLVSYYFSSEHYGVLGVSIANTIVYGIWSVSVIYTYAKMINNVTSSNIVKINRT